jgi:glycine/D-amino acid oxidase-like deaminating enzyme
LEDIKIKEVVTENLIIGSGVFGLSIANYLSDLKEDVLLVDKSFNPKEASHYALGRIDPILGGAGHGNETKPIDVAKISYLAYKKFIGLDKDFKNKIELEIKPTFHFYENNSEFEAIRKVINIIDSKKEHFSLESMNISNPDLKFTNQKFDKKVAKFDGTIFINSKKYREELFNQFYQNQSQYITDEIKKVNSFSKHVEVVGNNNIYKAQKVILATGPWTKLIEGVNLKEEIFPSKGQIIKLIDNEKAFTNYHLHGPCSIVRKKDGLIWVAATVEDRGFDKEITEDSKNELLQKAKKIYPNISDFEFHSQTACLRPSIIKDLPYIDKLPNKEIYIASGGDGWGIMMSILVGEILYKILQKS